jgi:ribonuclease P protein component
MIRSATDFARLQQEGKSRAHPLLLVRYRRNDLDCTRYGISTARRIGSAVVRNRVRRQLRALLRQIDPRIGTGWDVLIVARRAAVGVRHSELETALEQLLAGARLMKS